VAAFGLAGAFHAAANPVTVSYVEVAGQCASPANVNLTEELGPTPPFPAGERITYTVAAAATGDCSIAPGGGNDYEITATNLSGNCLADVFVVADSGTTFGNRDGTISTFRAKKIADAWPNGAVITFRLMDVAPNVAPNFDSLGVNSPGGPSNFSIVANIVPGGVCPSDLFVTSLPNSYLDFFTDESPPRVLPAGFFGAGSDLFTGRIYWVGAPLSGTNTAGADTIVARLSGATLTTCPSSATVPIEIIALSLQSNGPITVTFNGGATSSTYDVRACLSSVEWQPTGSMTIRQECPEGGTFDATLPVIPRLTFTKVSGASGLATVILDPADDDTTSPGIQAQVFMTVPSGFWSHTDPGYGVIGSPGGTVDHDCNGGTALRPFSGTSSNFFVGIGWDACNSCAVGNPPREPMKTLTEEQARRAAHGISDIQPLSNCCFTTDVDLDGDIDCVNAPTQEHCKAEGGIGRFFPTWVCVARAGFAPKLGDFCVQKATTPKRLDCRGPSCTEADAIDTGACCLPNDGCELYSTQDECVKLGGHFQGYGTTACIHNAAGDCIPTVSEWGLLVMAVLVLTAATVVIMRRRAMVRGGSYTR